MREELDEPEGRHWLYGNGFPLVLYKRKRVRGVNIITVVNTMEPPPWMQEFDDDWDDDDDDDDYPDDWDGSIGDLWIMG